MARAEIDKELPVDAKRFFEVITDYESYPQFVDSCTRTEVERASGEKEKGNAKVTYFINLIKEIDYTLQHSASAEKGELSWTLVKSAFLKKNTGRWKIESRGPGKCHVFYEIDIEFTIPVPGLILSRMIKSNLPKMVSDFEKRAK